MCNTSKLSMECDCYNSSMDISLPQVCQVVTPYLEGVAAPLASLDITAWIPVLREPGGLSAETRATATRARVTT